MLKIMSFIIKLDVKFLLFTQNLPPTFSVYVYKCTHRRMPPGYLSFLRVLKLFAVLRVSESSQVLKITLFSQ